ncbi:MAG: hypothetical protein Hals2KO_19840 [Halioglobus sp.]
MTALFANKHVIIALLVAPLLAVFTWLAVGELTGEKPRAAQPGASYPLLAKSNCRYASGQCDLENGDLALTLSARQTGAGLTLVMNASHPLDHVLLANASTASTLPSAMLRRDEAGRLWELPLEAIPATSDRLRLVALTGGSRYYVENGAEFLRTGTE